MFCRMTSAVPLAVLSTAAFRVDSGVDVFCANHTISYSFCSHLSSNFSGYGSLLPSVLVFRMYDIFRAYAERCHQNWLVQAPSLSLKTRVFLYDVHDAYCVSCKIVFSSVNLSSASAFFLDMSIFVSQSSSSTISTRLSSFTTSPI